MKRISEELLNSADSVKPARNFYTRYGKRALDIVLSGGALVVLSPLLGAVTVFELKFHGKPVLYHTMRPGKNGNPFKLYKFRSMTNAAGHDGKLLPDKDRLTKFGKFIRRTSIDELPELFNILKGDMSIIGPRPLLMEYLRLYSPRHNMRHYVRPGLACAHIHKKQGDTWTWSDQFENDIWYVENLSFITDVKELIAIFREIFAADDFRTNSTRIPFMGGDTLYETRTSEEIGTNKIVFDSVSMTD